MTGEILLFIFVTSSIVLLLANLHQRVTENEEKTETLIAFVNELHPKIPDILDSDEDD